MGHNGHGRTGLLVPLDLRTLRCPSAGFALTFFACLAFDNDDGFIILREDVNLLPDRVRALSFNQNAEIASLIHLGVSEFKE